MFLELFESLRKQSFSEHNLNFKILFSGGFVQAEVALYYSCLG